MKTLKIFILLFIGSIAAANAQFTKAELQVSGLTCSMCSNATEKSLRTLDFISDIKTDLNKNLFLITFKKDAPVYLDQISKKVQNAGFSVNNLKATFVFGSVKPSGDKFIYQGETYQLINIAGKTPDGPTQVMVADKGFAPPSVYKKYMSASEQKSGGKLYHLVLI